MAKQVTPLDTPVVEEPKVEPEVSEPEVIVESSTLPEKVLFQYDRDTALEATVLSRGDSPSTLHLQVGPYTFEGKKITSATVISDEPRVFKNVRPGSRFEPGTYYPL